MFLRGGSFVALECELAIDKRQIAFDSVESSRRKSCQSFFLRLRRFARLSCIDRRCCASSMSINRTNACRPHRHDTIIASANRASSRHFDASGRRATATAAATAAAADITRAAVSPSFRAPLRECARARERAAVARRCLPTACRSRVCARVWEREREKIERLAAAAAVCCRPLVAAPLCRSIVRRRPVVVVVVGVVARRRRRPPPPSTSDTTAIDEGTFSSGDGAFLCNARARAVYSAASAAAVLSGKSCWWQPSFRCLSIACAPQIGRLSNFKSKC